MQYMNGYNNLETTQSFKYLYFLFFKSYQFANSQCVFFGGNFLHFFNLKNMIQHFQRIFCENWP